MTRSDDATAERPASLSERLADGLLDLIAEQRLVPGDPLPTVRNLAVRFGVTPPTMREALRRLQATDAVQLKHGSGVYVGAGVLRTLMPNPNSAPIQGEQILYLVEARLAIEPSIAALAAENRTPEQLVKLEFAVDTALQQDTKTGAFLHFHRELAGASGNPVLFEVVDSMLAVRRREQQAMRGLIHDRSRDHDQHRAIFIAVRDKDPVAAAELTRRHLKELRDSTAQRLD
jgi:DNA-binding FadR family transcriptional regulator